MRSWVVILIGAMALWLAMRPAVANPSLKIGSVDLQRALNEVEEGKVAKDKLKKEFEDKQRKIEFRKNELGKLIEDAQAKKELLTETDLNKRQQEYQNKLAELQKTAVTYQQELAQRESELTNTIIERLKKVVEKVGKDEKYDLILQNVIAYGPDAKDLTEEVIKVYNKANKGGGK